MPMPAIDVEVREQGRVWLLPPYSYSVRRIADKLNVGNGTVNKWRQELKEEGLLPANVDGGKSITALSRFFHL